MMMDMIKLMNSLTLNVMLPLASTSKLRDTATKLGSKETFLKTWNSLLNNYGNLNIPFK